MADTNAEAYKKASDSYQAAMAADAEKKKKEGDAAKKIADAQAKALPKIGSREWFASRGVGPSGTPLEDPGAAPAPVAPAIAPTPTVAPVAQTGPAMGSREWFTARGVGPNGLPLEDPNAVITKTPTNAPMGSRDWFLAQGAGPNAAPAGEIPLDPRTIAVPSEVDAYQRDIEANRIQAGRSLGPPIEPLMKREEPAKPKAPEKPRLADKPSMSKIDKLIADMKGELGKGKKGPNFFDILQAAAAGWNMQTPAYVERQKEEAAKLADIEKLSKTAQFEKALQEERLASDTQKSEREIAARKELALMDAASGIGNIPGLSKGKNAAVSLLAGLGVPGAKNLVKPKITPLGSVAGGVH